MTMMTPFGVIGWERVTVVKCFIYHMAILLPHMQYVFDYQPGDVFACVVDLAWITGHSYVVYGPLCNGATTVLFASTATYPDSGTRNSSD